MVRIRFGPAGKPISFKGPMVKVPQFLRSIGLDAFEYEAVRGVRIRKEQAEVLGNEAEKYDIAMSIHAPYFINLSSNKEETVEKSKRRLVEAAKAAYYMKAKIVVFHPGYYLKYTPEEAYARALRALKEVEKEIKSLGLKNVMLGAETTGKKSELGSLDEVIRLAQEVDLVVPVIDWAHIYARSCGTMVTTISNVLSIIERVEKEVGKKALKPLHTHFSKIIFKEYGEKEHVVLSSKEHGPDFEVVCRALLEAGVDTVIISESPVLEQDALVMKKIYEKLKKELGK